MTTSSTTTTPITRRSGGPTSANDGPAPAGARRTTTPRPSTRSSTRAFICHVGFVDGGQPFVIPTAFARMGERLVLHGSAASRMLKALATGAPACVTVTLVDGLVLARSAFHHSMNYRSVVVVGSAAEITDPDEKRATLDAIVEHIVPGRSARCARRRSTELRGDARRRAAARRGVGQAAQRAAEGRRRGLRARRVGGRAAAAAPPQAAGGRPAAAPTGSPLPEHVSALAGAARGATLRVAAGAAARPCWPRRLAAARPFADERVLLDRRLETLRRILPDGPTAAADVLRGARRGRAGAPRARRGPAAGAFRVGRARRAARSSCTALGDYEQVDRFFQRIALSHRLVDVESMTLTATARGPGPARDGPALPVLARARAAAAAARVARRPADRESRSRRSTHTSATSRWRSPSRMRSPRGGARGATRGSSSRSSSAVVRERPVVVALRVARRGLHDPRPGARRGPACARSRAGSSAASCA